MQSKESQADTTQIQKEILSWKTIAVRLESWLYALPDTFYIGVDSDGNELAKPYLVTRSRRSYENPNSQYKHLVSSTALYNIIKNHLGHVNRKLELLERKHGSLDVSSDKLTQMTKTLEAIKNPNSRRHTLFMVNPRWVRMSDNEDDLYEEALSLVARTQIVDTTFIRDQLSIGNSEAEQLIKRLEADGFVSKLGDKALRRKVFVTVEDMDKREAERNANK